VSGQSVERQFDLLVAGELNPDVVVSGGDVEPAFGQVEKLVGDIQLSIGSSSAITACAAARLGLRVAFVGVVGADAFGSWMLAALGERGIDTTGCRVDESLQTGASVILAKGGDRAILTALGAIGALRPDELTEERIASARHLHVGSLFLQDELRRGLAARFGVARSIGVTTSFDPNWDPAGTWNGGIDAILAETDVVLPNAEEARRIAGEDEPVAAARSLIGRGGSDLPAVVAVKLGSGGGLVVERDVANRPAQVIAPTVAVADTIGAGDAFDAGFLAGYLAGRSPVEALKLAVACGSLSVRAVGGTAGQPTLDEASALAADLRTDAS
jgi:sugar/nucleoside kinase (ribokinase family)